MLPREVFWQQARVRRLAFRQLFWPPVASSWRTAVAGWLLRERAAWRMAFAAAASSTVVARLERFCHARTSTYVPGDEGRGSAQLEGRRQVWLMMQGHLRISDERLEAMRLDAAGEEGLLGD